MFHLLSCTGKEEGKISHDDLISKMSAAPPSPCSSCLVEFAVKEFNNEESRERSAHEAHYKIFSSAPGTWSQEQLMEIWASLYRARVTLADVREAKEEHLSSSSSSSSSTSAPVADKKKSMNEEDEDDENHTVKALEWNVRLVMRVGDLILAIAACDV